jgi:hypothetical protein
MKQKALAKQNTKKELKEPLNWTCSAKLSGFGLSETLRSDKHFNEAGLSDPIYCTSDVGLMLG